MVRMNQLLEEIKGNLQTTDAQGKVVSLVEVVKDYPSSRASTRMCSSRAWKEVETRVPEPQVATDAVRAGG